MGKFGKREKTQFNTRTVDEDAKYANYKKLEKFAEEKTEDEVEEVDAQAEEKQGKKKVVSQNFNFQFNREAKRGGRGRNDGGGGGNRGRGGFNRDNNQGRFNGRRSQQGYQKKVKIPDVGNENEFPSLA